MKKLIALAVAILMIAAMAVPAFAAKLGEDPEVEDYVVSDSKTVPSNTYGDEASVNGADNTANSGLANDEAGDTQSEGTRLVYGVGQSYVVSIPADIAFAEELTGVAASEGVLAKTKGYVYADYEIGLYDVVIAGDEYMKVTVASATSLEGVTSKDAWTLADTEGTKSSTAVNYYLTTDKFMTEITDTTAANAWMNATKAVLECDVQDGNAGTAGSENTAHIYFSSKGTAQEGTYRDIITFTVSVLTDDRT